MAYEETELGREVRAEVARILKRFEGADLAGVKMSTIRKLDAYLNPEPDTYTISPRCDAPTYEAMSNARIDRMREVDAAMGAV